MNALVKGILVTLLFVPGLLFAEAININTADKETLMTSIKGVGEKRAEAIIDYRQQNGPFQSIDELANISGIGQSIVDDNRGNISIGDE
jgi:competence protein ComEA